MFQEIFERGFFKNPFFWWSIFILILTTFHAFEPFFRTLEMILLQKLYIPILYGLVFLAIFLILYPIQRRLRLLLIQKNTRRDTLQPYSLIAFVVIIHVAYFWSDPVMIFTKLEEQSVTDKASWEAALDLKILFEYIAMPLVYAFSIMQVRKTIFKTEHPEFDSIKNNWKFGILLAFLAVISYLFSLVVSWLS